MIIITVLKVNRGSQGGGEPAQPSRSSVFSREYAQNASLGISAIIEPKGGKVVDILSEIADHLTEKKPNLKI